MPILIKALPYRPITPVLPRGAPTQNIFNMALRSRPREIPTAAAAGVLAVWGAVVHHSYKKEAARQAAQLAKGEAQPKDRSASLLKRERWVDSPLVAWLCENWSVWLMAFVRLGITCVPPCRAPPPPSADPGFAGARLPNRLPFFLAAFFDAPSAPATGARAAHAAHARGAGHTHVELSADGGGHRSPLCARVCACV